MGARWELESGKSLRKVRDMGGDEGKGKEVVMTESSAFTTDNDFGMSDCELTGAAVWTGCLIYLAALIRSMYSWVQLNSKSEWPPDMRLR